MKTFDELEYETYDNRTIIVKNLPQHYKQEQLVQIFNDYGSIMAIEMPVKNLAIEDSIKNKTDMFVEERRDK